jgi:hypothetical protein
VEEMVAKEHLMMLTLDLPAELESELSVHAAQLGLTLPEYALRILASARTLPASLETGAELVSYWQHEGLIGERSDISDSQSYARRLRGKASKRKIDS